MRMLHLHVHTALCLLFLSGCAAWKNATSSDQWIELPAPAGATNEILLREWTIVQQATPITNMMQAADLMLRGHVRSYGPADVTRTAKVYPSTGMYEFTFETKQSGTWGGIFRGLYSTASYAGDWIALAASGAKP